MSKGKVCRPGPLSTKNSWRGDVHCSGSLSKGNRLKDAEDNPTGSTENTKVSYILERAQI